MVKNSPLRAKAERVRSIAQSMTDPHDRAAIYEYAKEIEDADRTEGYDRLATVPSPFRIERSTQRLVGR